MQLTSIATLLALKAGTTFEAGRPLPLVTDEPIAFVVTKVDDEKKLVLVDAYLFGIWLGRWKGDSAGSTGIRWTHLNEVMAP
ncbi:hypothetical protein [Roseococcus pinisoli]|uniref:Uncharacterized protein n=1 Tax=Roseococcus pinisoli TaxID=2835040 RepID=A0ABS5QF91_9PROT|nr:hypothetical protein [Roseococcus pinisoli]MBS7812365.1 hypothetical protein [Roseococcus pinisoli]